MHKITLTNGMHSLISAEDHDRLSAHTWWVARQPHADNKCYATTNIGGRHVFMHRFILGAAKGQIVDHINRDRLDNRRENLRICSFSENSHNHVRRRRVNSTGYRGVEFRPACIAKPYRASLYHANRVYRGPSRSTAIESALDYDRFAREFYGKHAITNFPLAEIGRAG